MSGCMAFYHDTPVEFCKKVMDMDWSMDWTEDDLEEDETNPFDEISQEGKDFVKKLIAFDPKDRFTAKEALNHSWLHVPVSFYHPTGLRNLVEIFTLGRSDSVPITKSVRYR